MKGVFRWLFNLIEDVASLRSQNYTRQQRLQIAANYLRLTIRSLGVFGKIVKPTAPASVCGYTIENFSHTSVFYLFREIFIHGEYNFQPKTDNPTFFDVGANIGMATIFFKWKYPACEVRAFEPDPDTFQVLQNNVKRNSLQNVTLYNVAIGGHEGEVDFFTNSPEKGSLTMSVGRERRAGRHFKVMMKTLSGFLTTPTAYVKIDTEGSETSIVPELVTTGTIDRVGEMVIEFHHHINNEYTNLSEILYPIEQAGFDYVFRCPNRNLLQPGIFQDIMLYCYRNVKGS